MSADLTSMSARQRTRAAAAYVSLARRPAAKRASTGGEVDVTFGDTAAAKAMFALRPKVFPPMDEQIRAAFGWNKLDADQYESFLDRSSDALEGLAARMGVAVPELPSLLGRPNSTPAKLLDEYLWICVARPS
jgi:hypothetical protein